MKIPRHWKLLLATWVTAAAITGLSDAPAMAGPDTNALYNSAQRAFTDGDDAAGRAELRQLIAADPADAEALSLQAIWSHYAGDLPAFADSLARLTAVDPELAQGTNNVLGAIGAAVGTLPNPLPAIVGPQTGIVVLGYGLLPDGSLRPELVNRLTAAWLQAVASPLSPIIVTGGNPQNGITEAEAMRAWLVGKGLPASRINVESRAGSTVQNALFSTKMLRDVGASSAVVVTSPNHIRRAVADFIVAGTQVVGATTSLEQLVSQLPPPAKQSQRGIYLDATRTFQLATSR
ncbi:YdcF family protein [Nocardia sp. NBC_00565]|uniref:YdcF family protein n=1 Tax=Nocardia sp. NBC_00565 TaxID=2975993 RepID=UPI002E819E8F|nr:YdcF family protein [Nocardia sp. NBC_00565]WUC05341.1 YdcF family protein [Nocardia sp. NBC_00565]